MWSRVGGRGGWDEDPGSGSGSGREGGRGMKTLVRVVDVWEEVEIK